MPSIIALEVYVYNYNTNTDLAGNLKMTITIWRENFTTKSYNLCVLLHYSTLVCAQLLLLLYCTVSYYY